MLKPGMILCDRYEVIDTVGAGGMSIVYKAKDHRLNRNVAIKVLKPEFSNDRNFVTKFKIEAQASAGLSHPNVVNIIDVYDDDGLYFIVMELVDGITLKEYIEKHGRLNMETALDFAIQIASGLEAAHESHIIHRDIKPQNIIVSKSGIIKVTDFGIAKAATSNTLTSGAMGSVHYISPEQARGGFSDERSDIYSLGITMYEMVTGRVPFESDNNISIALMHIQSEMISPRQYYPDIYTSFEKIIQKATQKKPERRYLTASALIADLKRVQSNPNIDIVVAPSAITNSPTQEWTKEDIQAVRDGSLLNTFGDNTPVQNEMGELKPIGGGASSKIQVDNRKINELLEEDPWDEEEEEEVVVAPVKRGNLKKVQDYEEEDDYDDEDDSEIDPGLKKAVMIAGVATAVIVIIIIFVIIGNFMGLFKFGNKATTDTATGTEEVQPIAMISVYGYSEEAALKMLENLEFTNVKVEYGENDEMQEGYVYDQSIEKGKMIQPDDEIIIYVSAPAELVKVPDVKNYEDQQAMTVLGEAELEFTHAYEFSDDVEKDRVIRTEPEAGTMVPKGTKITIVISNGPENEEIAVPNLYGLTESEARNSLEKNKLKVGNVTHEYSDTVDKGKVISQNPGNGTTVKEGTSVDFVISDGKEPKEITYKATISGTVTCNDASLDGQAVTIRVLFNGEVVSTMDITIIAGTPYSIGGTKGGLASQSGSATVEIIDASGANITSSFTPNTSVSYVEEQQ